MACDFFSSSSTLRPCRSVSPACAAPASSLALFPSRVPRHELRPVITSASVFTLSPLSVARLCLCSSRWSDSQPQTRLSPLPQHYPIFSLCSCGDHRISCAARSRSLSLRLCMRMVWKNKGLCRSYSDNTQVFVSWGRVLDMSHQVNEQCPTSDELLLSRCIVMSVMVQREEGNVRER